MLNQIYLLSVIPINLQIRGVLEPQTGLLKLYLQAAGEWTIIQNYLNTVPLGFENIGLLIQKKTVSLFIIAYLLNI